MFNFENLVEDYHFGEINDDKELKNLYAENQKLKHKLDVTMRALLYCQQCLEYIYSLEKNIEQ